MSTWSDKFRSKEQLAIDQAKAEILTLERQIKESEKEILAGAPEKDHDYVVKLKASYEGYQGELAKQKRHLVRLEQKRDEKASRGANRGRS